MYHQWQCQYIWYKNPDAEMSEKLLNETDFSTPEALAYKAGFERALSKILSEIINWKK